MLQKAASSSHGEPANQDQECVKQQRRAGDAESGSCAFGRVRRGRRSSGGVDGTAGPRMHGLPIFAPWRRQRSQTVASTALLSTRRRTPPCGARSDGCWNRVRRRGADAAGRGPGHPQAAALRDVAAALAVPESADVGTIGMEPLPGAVRSGPEAGAVVLREADRAARLERAFAAVLRRVIDGDTLAVTLDLGFGMQLEGTIRLRGIDSPEHATAPLGCRPAVGPSRGYVAVFSYGQPEREGDPPSTVDRRKSVCCNTSIESVSGLSTPLTLSPIGTRGHLTLPWRWRSRSRRSTSWRWSVLTLSQWFSIPWHLFPPCR